MIVLVYARTDVSADDVLDLNVEQNALAAFTKHAKYAKENMQKAWYYKGYLNGCVADRADPLLVQFEELCDREPLEFKTS